MYTELAHPRVTIQISEFIRKGMEYSSHSILGSLCLDVKVTLDAALGKDGPVDVIWTTYAGGTISDILIDLEWCSTRHVEKLARMLASNDVDSPWSSTLATRRALIRTRTQSGEMYELTAHIRRAPETTGTEGVTESHMT